METVQFQSLNPQLTTSIQMLSRFYSVIQIIRCVLSIQFRSSKPSIFISLSKEVPTTYSSSINMDQAKVLTSFVSFLNASGKCCTVTQKVREASSGVSDSDDEEVADPAISPAFTDSELLAVQTYYEKLCSAFRSAVVHQFTNAAGKMFYHLAEFILILRPNKQYVPYISTNPHGDCQPGSANITHTIPKPCTRQPEASSTTTSSSTEKVSDFVVFDHSTMTMTKLNKRTLNNCESSDHLDIIRVI